MLVTKNISKSFGAAHVLKGVDLEIAPGQITCLIGPSGTGKTTLLRALSLLDPPTAGSVIIEEETFKFPLPEGVILKPPWPRLTVVFQQLFLWPHLTLKENILLPARNIKNAARCAQDLDKLVELFGMGHFIDRYPNQASLGQRQRVALARALMLEPTYILMDEITSSLDVEQIAKILPHLQELKKEGIGIFLITHLLGFARRAADQIAFMDDGKIVETGGPEIIDKPKSERLKQFVSTVKAAS